MLDLAHTTKCFKEGQINKEEYDFLNSLIKYNYTSEEDDISYEDSLIAFAECVRSETDYSFLVFEGVDLVYVDHDGQTYNTKIVND